MNSTGLFALCALASATATAQGARSVCPPNAGKPSVTGTVVDARNGAALQNAAIAVDWDDLTLNHGTLRTSHHQAKTSPDNSGRFSICGLPVESPLTLRITADGFREIRTEFALPPDGVLRHDFRLAEERVSAGVGSLRARVVDDTGRAMTTGRATIAALGRHVEIDSGRISFGGLPSGTWVVDLKAIGYERVVVLLDTDEPTPRTIRMDRSITVLDPVSVIEKSMGPDRKTLNDIALRMRTAGGTLIVASDLSLRNATRASDPLPSARGFYLKKDGYQARFPNCKSNNAPGRPGIAVYLDGARMGDLQTVNSLVPPSDLLAIEAYPEVTSAPFLWRTHDACAVVAFWTKKR
jgi:hypothetical protein